MNISSTRLNHSPKLHQQSSPSPGKGSALFSEEPKDGWISTGVSLAGGMVALGGAFSNQPLIAAGGALMTAAATALTAQRVQAQGAMDSAAWLSFAGGGALTVASALCLAQASPSVGPTGPLPTLLRQLGIQTL